MRFDVGALVKVRGREWVVLPESRHDAKMLILRPLGGTEDEITGIYLPLEDVQSAEFSLPNPDVDLGNQLSCGLLRDAVRLGFRSGAGPFRSLAKIAIEPRPYQIVPLLMALKLDPIRLLIADDVGIGKTVEACLIARELIDRGEIQRLSVLCPPHLAEQWQAALRDQFHIDAVLVLSGSAARLERECRQDESLFEHYPFTVVSTDYIKGERRRDEFIRTCPELVIVDEVHTCAAAGGRAASQKRHELLQELVDPKRENALQRHLILVSATPHSGNEDTFRSLLSLLKPELRDLPRDLSGDQNRKHREHLAKHFVQRRRGDLKAYLDTITPFPEREIKEDYYEMDTEYRKFVDDILDYCKEIVLDDSLDKRRKRVRWWSALALLRAISSSPAAAASTLRNRSVVVDVESIQQIDERGRQAVLDMDDASTEGIDITPGSDDLEEDETNRRKLRAFAIRADDLKEIHDEKLKETLKIVNQFLDDGFAPILFCRFIPTVEYVAEYLRKKLKKRKVVVEAITGALVPEEREKRVNALADEELKVLVCTDCLSEGINLQHAFDAVMHYDLAWNPTRHEQREGRVDRYGQPKDKVRTLTFYGRNNPVDGIVLQVLLRKHKAIHKTLGVIVPVPMDTTIIEDAILEGLLIRDTKTADQLSFEFLEPLTKKTDLAWDNAVDREKKSRSIFAQNQMLRAVNEEVRTELEAVRKTLGNADDVKRFTINTLRSLGANPQISETEVDVNIEGLPRALKDSLGIEKQFRAVFDGQIKKNTLTLTRTHPVIEALSGYVLETALDDHLDGPGKRCGVIRTQKVNKRTTVLLLRLRFHIINKNSKGVDTPLLAEDLVLVGFRGSPDTADWLPQDDIDALILADASQNTGSGMADNAIRRIIDRIDAIRPYLDKVANERGAALLDAHKRVRGATNANIRSTKVDVHTPADILGIYVYLPDTTQGDRHA